MSNRPICGSDTPDPWMVAAHGKFYFTFTLGNRVEIWQSAHLEKFHECQKSVIWVRPPHHFCYAVLRGWPRTDPTLLAQATCGTAVASPEHNTGVELFWTC